MQSAAHRPRSLLCELQGSKSGGDARCKGREVGRGWRTLHRVLCSSSWRCRRAGAAPGLDRPGQPAARLRVPHPPSVAPPWQGRSRTMATQEPVTSRVDPTRATRPGNQRTLRSWPTFAMVRQHQPAWLPVNPAVGAFDVRGRRPASGTGTGTGARRSSRREAILRMNDFLKCCVKLSRWSTGID